MTVQQQLDGIKVGDKLGVMLGFSNDLKIQEGEVVAVLLCDSFLLIRFPEGIVYANTWHVPQGDDYLPGRAVINPMNSGDCESQDELAVHQINVATFIDDTYEGGLFEIVTINGAGIDYSEED
jgi:hypothetical protein